MNYPINTPEPDYAADMPNPNNNNNYPNYNNAYPQQNYNNANYSNTDRSMQGEAVVIEQNQPVMGQPAFGYNYGYNGYGQGYNINLSRSPN